MKDSSRVYFSKNCAKVSKETAVSVPTMRRIAVDISSGLSFSASKTRVYFFRISSTSSSFGESTRARFSDPAATTSKDISAIKSDIAEVVFALLSDDRLYSRLRGVRPLEPPSSLRVKGGLRGGAPGKRPRLE